MVRRKPCIYCDTNVYSRPFDEVVSPRIHLEAEACIKIFSLASLGKITLLGSDILKYEVEHSDIEKRLRIRPLLDFCKAHINQNADIKNLAKDLLREIRLSPRDSLHLASAIAGNSNFFLTCDDEIIRKAGHSSKQALIIINPIEFIYRHYED